MPKRSNPASTVVAELILRPAAEADLADLYHYIAEFSGSHEIAIGYIRRIRARCENLLAFPESGRRHDDLRRDLRIIGFERRVMIAYIVLPAGDVEIGRILYGGQNYEVLLGDYKGT